MEVGAVLEPEPTDEKKLASGLESSPLRLEHREDVVETARVSLLGQVARGERFSCGRVESVLAAREIALGCERGLDLSEGVEDGGEIALDELAFAAFGELEVRAQAPALKQRLNQVAGERPHGEVRIDEILELVRGSAARRRDAHTRKGGASRFEDAGARRLEATFRRGDVGPAQEEVRWKPDRNDFRDLRKRSHIRADRSARIVAREDLDLPANGVEIIEPRCERGLRGRDARSREANVDRGTKASLVAVDDGLVRRAIVGERRFGELHLLRRLERAEPELDGLSDERKPRG